MIGLKILGLEETFKLNQIADNFIRNAKSDLDGSIFFQEKLQSQEKFITPRDNCLEVYPDDFGHMKFCADDQDHSVGKCNVLREAKGSPLVCDGELHGLAIMGCSNIHLYLNIRDYLAWIQGYISGSTVPYEVCSSPTNELKIKTETENDFNVEKVGFSVSNSIRPKIKNMTGSFDFYNAS